MNYVESLNIFDIDYKEIPCIRGNGAPTTATVGAIGSLYMDVNTSGIYKCTAVSDNVYTWKTLGGTSYRLTYNGAVDAEAAYNAYQNGAYVYVEGSHEVFSYNSDGAPTYDTAYFSLPLVNVLYNDVVGTYELYFAGVDNMGHRLTTDYTMSWNSIIIYKSIDFPTDENGNIIYGAAGQFLASNGMGGTTWLPVVNVSEEGA